jgi:hypothetical protein
MIRKVAGGYKVLSEDGRISAVLTKPKKRLKSG